MSKRRSKTEWVAICQAQDRSGESAAVFARKRGLRRETLQWWRWKLGQEQALEGKRGSFVEVVGERAERTPGAVVRVGEVVIEFNDGAPAASWIADLATRC